MKQLIGSPWFGVFALTAAAVLTGTSLRLSFGQPPLPGSVAESPASVESPAIAEAALTNPQLQAEQASRRPGGLSTQAGAQGNMSQYTISAEMGAMKMGTMMTPSYSPAASDAEIRELIDAYRQHDGQNEKTRIAEALPDLVAKQFDARQLVREDELKQLEEQLRKLQELHHQRAKQRDQIIQERVRQLLRDAEGLGWGSDDESQPSAQLHYSRPRAGGYSRERQVPCLATCGGFQHMVLEYARNVLGYQDAQHAEYDPYASNLFISRLACSLVGREMDLSFVEGSRTGRAYGGQHAKERYYCNFGVHPDRVEILRSGELLVVASDREGEVRAIESPSHSFFVGTLYVPQMRSTVGAPHPLVNAFLLEASIAS